MSHQPQEAQDQKNQPTSFAGEVGAGAMDVGGHVAVEAAIGGISRLAPGASVPVEKAIEAGFETGGGLGGETFDTGAIEQVASDAMPGLGWMTDVAGSALDIAASAGSAAGEAVGSVASAAGEAVVEVLSGILS